jgi:hypothetical protein
MPILGRYVHSLAANLLLMAGGSTRCSFEDGADIRHFAGNEGTGSSCCHSQLPSPQRSVLGGEKVIRLSRFAIHTKIYLVVRSLACTSHKPL